MRIVIHRTESRGCQKLDVETISLAQTDAIDAPLGGP